MAIAWATWVAELTQKSTADGAEKIPCLDGPTPNYIEIDAIVTYVNAQQQDAPLATPAATDDLQGASSDGTQETYTVAALSTYVIGQIEAASIDTDIAATDYILWTDKSSGNDLTRGLVSDLTTLINTAALNFTTLTPKTPLSGDFFAFEDGGVGKRVTLSALEAVFYADFDTYVTETLTVLPDGQVDGDDELWLYDATATGPKSVTADALKTFCATAANAGNVIAPVATTEGYIPRWTGSPNTLDNYLSVSTEVGSGGHDTLVSEQGIREAITASEAAIDIVGLSPIPEAIVDGDSAIVYNLSGTANAEVFFSDIWTWIGANIAGSTAKTEPIDADTMVISDSVAANAAKTTTCLQLKDYMGISDLETTEGAGITGIAESFVSGVEKVGTMFRTTIVIDLAGLDSSASGQIIGDSGTGAAHLGQITAATNGTIFTGKIECFETPVTGEADIRLYSATVETGVEGNTISGLIETPLSAGGGLAADAFESVSLPSGSPPSGDYLYLVSNGAAAGTYSAGKICITLWGK